jgi:hypothetical protein
MLPQIKNLDFGFYKYFNVANNLFIHLLKSPEVALYKLNKVRKMDIFLNPAVYSNMKYQFYY